MVQPWWFNIHSAMKKYTINITLTDRADEYYKVSLKDHNGSTSTVYEPTIAQAIYYAKVWCEESEERQHAKDVMNKAILESIALDKIAGITKNNSDSLD